MRLILLLITSLLFLTALTAQRPSGKRIVKQVERITIKGTLLDAETQQTLEFATISVHSVKDSALIAGGVTDMSGKFSVESPSSEVYLALDFIGYKTAVVTDVPIPNGSKVIDMKIISLSPGGVNLDDIEITAERSETTFALDKKVFTVGKDLANRGGTAQEILDNVPSVTVDVEGNVSLRGSENVRILIDGKPSGLIGIGESGGLRSIPSNLISQVEVVTNPSAKYEAAGTAGIINIVLKKDKRAGFNGSFEMTLGNPSQYGAGANINYRSGKINWFASYNLQYRESPGFGVAYQNYYQGDSTLITQIDRDMSRSGMSHNMRFGADYFLTDNQTITASLNYRIGDDDNTNTITYRDLTVPGILSSTDRIIPSFDDPYTLRTDDELEDESKHEYSLDYRKKFIEKGRSLSGRASFQDNGETEQSILTNQSYQSGLSLGNITKEQVSTNDENETRTLVQLDYKHPIGKDGKIEVGGQTSLRKIRNDFAVSEKEGEDFLEIAERTNDFQYNEDVHAAYLIYGSKLNKWSYQVGLRSEYSIVKTELLQTEKVNDRDYFGLFPSAFLNYDLPAGQSIQLSYSRRIQRPRFWDLNPFFSFTDERNFFSGNPNLDPEYTDSYETQYIKIWDSGNIGGSIYYRHTEDARQRIKEVDPLEGTSVTIPVNLATQDNIGLEMLFSYNGIKWLRLDGNANLFRAQTEGEYNGQNFDVDTYSWTGRLTSRFTFWDGADFQVRANHRAGRETQQGTRGAVTSLDLGFTKDLLNKNLTVTLSVRDLFNSRKRIYERFGPDFYEDGEFQWRNRSASLTANYRINMKKQRGRSVRSSGDGEF
jgi:outer membrane receptor protein involved in Fe transport